MPQVNAIVILAGFLWAALPALALDNPESFPENLRKPSDPASGTAMVNNVPYISTYYFKPKVEMNEKAVINYYVTDFFHKEYLKDEATESFTVDYWVNGAKHTLKNVKAGDNSIDPGVLPKGKVLFALQAMDKAGAKSHRLYFEFLVVDPAEEKIPEEKVLHPDLAQFKISSDDTNPVETTAGLTAMLKFASDKGYRKVVLPRGGRYRIDENATIQMATNLTLDMNGSTFKLNPNARAGCLMLEFIDCHDSHVANGIFEGDINEHDYAKSPNHAEWVNCMSISQGSEYCSVRDVTIKDITGYGTCTNHRHSKNGPQAPGEFFPGDIDDKGQDIPSETRTSSRKMVDVSTFIQSHGFIQMGIYLGYQGNPAGKWVYKAHFYDAESKFLETIEGYLYRRLYPPKNAKFARFTLLSTATPKNLSVYNFRAPYNCAYINVIHQNIRCVGMALCGFDNFLVEGCRFDNCGQKLARCAFDAEDGWDMMHDLTFRNNIFGENPANEFLTCAGHNFVMENNTMKAYIWERTNGYVFRDNTLKSAEYRCGKASRTGYARVYRNTHQNGAAMKMAVPDPDREYCIKDNTLEKGFSSTGKNVYAYKCRITGGSLNGKVVGCEIRNTANAGGGFEIYDSKVADCHLKTSGAVVAKVVGSTVTNSKCATQGSTIILEKNTLNEVTCMAGGDWSDAHEYILTDNIINTAADHLVSVGNSYKQVVLRGNVVNSTNKDFAAVHLSNPIKSVTQVIDVQNNKFNAAGGSVLKVDRLPAAACTLTVNLINNECKGIGRYTTNIATLPNVKINEK